MVYIPKTFRGDYANCNNNLPITVMLYPSVNRRSNENKNSTQGELILCENLYESRVNCVPFTLEKL
jgi:hypothetical protein